MPNLLKKKYFRFRAIRFQLLLAFGLIVVFTSAAISVTFITMGYQTGRRQTIGHMISIAVHKEAEIKTWIENLQNELEIALAEENAHSNAVALLSNEKDGLMTPESYRLVQWFREIMSIGGWFDELFLMSRRGETVLSTDLLGEFEFRALQPYFKKGLAGPGICAQTVSYSFPATGLHTLVAVRPVKDNQGRTIGVLCGRAGRNKLNQIMSLNTGLGETGETYLVGENNLLFTRLNRGGYEPGKTYVHSSGANTALERRVNGSGIYTGFQGVSVIGAWRWLPDLEMGLLAEQNKDEAFTALNTTIAVNVGIALMTVLFAVVFSLIYTDSITRPLMRLTGTVRRIGKGDFHAVADVAGSVEIDVLAKAFNRMAGQLRHRIETEELISDISKMMIGRHPENFEDSLKKIGRFLDADRGYLWVLGERGESPEQIAHWHGKGIEPYNRIPDTLEFESACRLWKQNKKKRGTDDFEAPVPEWEKKGIRSLIRAPLFVGEKPYGIVEFHTIRKDRQWISQNYRLLRTLAEIFCNAVKRQRIETAIKKSERDLIGTRNYLNNIIDSMPSVVVGVDRDFRVTQWNREAEKETGVAREDAIGRPLVELYANAEAYIDRMGETMATGKPMKIERLPAGVDEMPRFADVIIYPLTEKGSDGAVVRVDDVTERIKIEELMIQSEKMMSVGGLAAGMAHEINNPLGGIQGAIQVIRLRTSDTLEENHRVARECGTDIATLRLYLEKRKIAKYFDNIGELSSRAAKIVADMLHFSRRGESDKVPVNLAELIEKTLALAAGDFDLKKRFDFKKIRIVRKYGRQSLTIPCIETEIQQVLLNIFKNAAHALSDRKDPDGPPQIVIRTQNEGETARIEIEDNGPGMDEEQKKRVFEPFFTTKPVGEGTGLGLSVSYFIIKQSHGGNISVESSPGKGCRFVIRLPF